ncbi:MAG TPA: hypothetical protein VLR46_05525 [Candidatus Dormibacteraeota bacterium]|nr:hypothetical protein [Candidatus Dormibacteraeota bacterium]
MTIQHMSVCTWRGRQVNDYPLESVAARFGFEPAFVHRADLQAALATRFGVEGLHFDADVSGFKERGAEVEVVIRGTVAAAGELLVGADGFARRCAGSCWKTAIPSIWARRSGEA